jgi:hypothetical protein
MSKGIDRDKLIDNLKEDVKSNRFLEKELQREGASVSSNQYGCFAVALEEILRNIERGDYDS